MISNTKLEDKTKIFSGIAVLIFIFILFIYQNDMNGFVRGHHGYLSSHGMAISRNLSISTHFLMYHFKYKDENDTVRYSPYNRFPVTAFLVIKLATMWADHDLSMQISIARDIMNLFLIGSFICSFSALKLITEKSIISLISAFITFSSSYLLYYNDMIFNDIPALFGVLLAFHGVVVYEKKNKFRQYLLESLIAVSLGWQAFFILLPYALIKSIIGLKNKKSIKVLLKIEALHVALLSLFFGAFILSFNLLNEYLVSDKPLTELSSVQSAKYRMGFSDKRGSEPPIVRSWKVFIPSQIKRIGRLSIPHILIMDGGEDSVVYAAGFLCILLSILFIWLSKHKLLFSMLVLSGILWAICMRTFVAYHDFQSIFYIGIPLVLYINIMNLVFRLRQIQNLKIFFIVLSLFIISLSCIHMNLIKAMNTDRANSITADYQVIYDKIGKGNKIHIMGDRVKVGGGFHGCDFYLSGNYIQTNPHSAVYFIASSRNLFPQELLLTPENKHVFLFQCDVNE